MQDIAVKQSVISDACNLLASLAIAILDYYRSSPRLPSLFEEFLRGVESTLRSQDEQRMWIKYSLLVHAADEHGLLWLVQAIEQAGERKGVAA